MLGYDIMKEAHPEGKFPKHDAYFKSAEGAKTRQEYEDRLRDYYKHEGEPIPKDIVGKSYEYFYSEKCLAKCNAIKSKKEMSNAPRPSGHKKRLGISDKRGGAPTIKWDKVFDKFDGFTV